MADQSGHVFSDDFGHNNSVSHAQRMTNGRNSPTRAPLQQLPYLNLHQPQHASGLAHRAQQRQDFPTSQLRHSQVDSNMHPTQCNYSNEDSSTQRLPKNAFMASPAVSSQRSILREPDIAKLLISMAEEYFEAAQQLAPFSARTLSGKSIEKCQKLVAIGLGCLETALKRVTGLDPRDEACVRLRYASVLFEETENAMEAETTLSKGIELCKRNHYYDLKYAMYFLLAQCVAKSNLKASIKALDAHISEAETFSNVSWVYAFRFLRASHSLACGTFIDSNAAVRNLRVIAALAEQYGDRPIHFLASLMEVTAHLRISGPEASQNLKSSMASVWSHQTNSSCYIPPLFVYAHILDLACSIREGDPQEMMTKLQAARNAMDASIRNKDWGSGDIISIPIPSSANASRVVSTDTGIILGIGNDGADTLMITFLDQKDAYCISCLLYGVVLLQRSANERLTALKYLNQGLSILEKDDESKSSKSLPNQILPNLIAKRRWRGQIICYIRIYLAFCHSLSAEWPQVKECLENLEKTLEKFEIPLTKHLECLLIYLSAIYHQGSGDLTTALEILEDPRFKIPTERPSNVSSVEQMEYDIAILAGLNTLSILQHPKRFDPVKNIAMLNMLEPVCLAHTNQDIVNAFNLIMVTVKTNPPKTLMEVKHYLSAALNGAKKTNNSQLLSITVTLMFSFFFVGVLGTQAENGAQAASRTAAKSGNPLWMSVADSLLARCNELHGKMESAQATMALARKSAVKVSLNP
ncbi:putative cohesin loading factor [Golovinomyces cichoracearum]|uniref:Putative cohesin loading factor n=1 Tax=Golovinomyces cichoracearum TaxID=62708 RepID=A0A420H9M1_9PEZI|nr:putative cohesin loading factor [Golovinomyces cichoracearum]